MFVAEWKSKRKDRKESFYLAVARWDGKARTIHAINLSNSRLSASNWIKFCNFSQTNSFPVLVSRFFVCFAFHVS